MEEKNEIMTPKEFADAIEEIAGYSEMDPELAHIEADKVMCNLLRDLGYSKGVAEFEFMKKWYV